MTPIEEYCQLLGLDPHVVLMECSPIGLRTVGT